MEAGFPTQTRADRAGAPTRPVPAPPAPLRFAEAARRLGAAARAAGLVVPAFRTPPRRPGDARTIRRLPGGAVVSVRVRARPASEVVADMIDGVVAANGLRGPAAERVRALLAGAMGFGDCAPSVDRAPARVA